MTMFFLPEPGLRPRLAGVRIRFARHWATSVCVGGHGEKEKRERKEGRRRRGKGPRRRRKMNVSGEYSALYTI